MEEEASGLFCRVSETGAAYGSGLGGSGALGAAVPGRQLWHFYSGRAALHGRVRRGDRSGLSWQRRVRSPEAARAEDLEKESRMNTEKSPLISVIVPVYKVEEYLPACLDSLLAQTYRNFELLLVDDGSPDNCPALCDEWARKDNRIKALHKPNGGLSDARNYGLDHAQGDYVIFVDSDDFWVGKDCLGNLMNVVDANPECDFIGFNCSYFYSDTNTFNKWVVYDESLSTPTDKDTVLRSLVASGTFPMSACLKILKRKALFDMNLRFIKETIAEDIPWFIDLLDGTKKCMFVNQYIYAYRQNVAGSITASGNPKSLR